jgi:hypothetical protein
MGGQQGYSKVTTNNLIFAYDTGDKINSYKGRPTDNLIANAGISIYNNVGGDVSITLTQTSDSYKGASIWKEVITPTTSTGVSYLTNGNNPGIGVVTTGGGGIANRYTGHTIFFKPVGPMFSSPIFTQYSNISGWQSTNQYEDMGDGWFRAKVLWYDTVTRTDGKYWAINPSGATINVPITIYWAGPFKEDLNSTTISQFINGTRSVTQGLINLSNPAATLDLTSVSFHSNAQVTFDGTDDYISIANSTSYGNFTAEVVIKPTSYPGNAASAISTEYPGSNSTVNFTIGFDVSQFMGGFFNASSGGWHQIFTSLPTLNVYSHYVLTYNGAQMVFYKNGSSIGTLNTTDIAAGGNPIRIGRRWDNPDYFPGKIDVAKIYNKALTQSEIKQNYNHYKTRFSLT